MWHLEYKYVLFKMKVYNHSISHIFKCTIKTQYYKLQITMPDRKHKIGILANNTSIYDDFLHFLSSVRTSLLTLKQTCSVSLAYCTVTQDQMSQSAPGKIQIYIYFIMEGAL